MGTYVGYCVEKYSSKGVVVDTDLLILYIIGSCSPDYISKFNRTYQYTIEDFQIINNLLQLFKSIIITPQILSELSNLTFKKVSKFNKYFATVVNLLRDANERYIHKDDMLLISCLPKVGFTDLSIIEAAKNNKLLVLTDDFRLTNFLVDAKCDFINLNHIRTELWLRND